MSDLDYTNRQLLPRWVTFSKIESLYPGDNKILIPSEIEKEDYLYTTELWKLKKTLALAFEIIAFSRMFDNYDEFYQDALDYLSYYHSEEFSNNTFLGDFLNKRKEEKSLEERIKELKREIKLPVSGIISWVDMAYNYLLLGQKEKAEKCIRAAIGYSPQDAFTLRSIARFFLINNDPEKAIWILLKNEDKRNDPRIISSEIAIAEANGLGSKLLRKAVSIIKYSNRTDKNENELFATMGTLAFNSGNSKKGMKLFNDSVLAPNENIVAQIRYVTNRYNKDFDLSGIRTPKRHEADAWIAYKKNDFEAVRRETKEWFLYQPFSSRPAIMNSYINSLIFQDEKQSIDIAQKSLRIKKDNFTLQNNLVVALYRDGQIEEANKQMNILRHMNGKNEDDSYILFATEGLSAFRNGKIELGNELYERAIKGFENLHEDESKARASIYWANELKEVNPEQSKNLLGDAYSIAKNKGYNDLSFAIEKNYSLEQK